MLGNRLEQRVVRGGGQIQLRVFVFVFTHQAAQRGVELLGEGLQLGQRGRRLQVRDDFERFALLFGKGLGLFKRGARFGAAGVVVDLHGRDG